MDLGGVSNSLLLLALVLLGGGFLVLLGLGYCVYAFMAQRRGRNPYTGLRTLRPFADLGFEILREVHIYIHNVEPVYVPDLGRAAVCELSGRIFPNAISRWGRLVVPPNFETTAYPGKWVRLDAMYIDAKSKNTLQWLAIPGRDLEILLVQKPPSMPL